MSGTTPIETRWDSADTPVVGIAQAIMQATDRDQANMPPLQEFINTDSVNALLGTDSADPVYLAFTYEDYRIRAQSTGALTIVSAATETARLDDRE